MSISVRMYVITSDNKLQIPGLCALKPALHSLRALSPRREPINTRIAIAYDIQSLMAST